MERKKNEYINLLKGIACIIVIFLHCPFPGFVGECIIYGLRFSVPIFFMISGYYSHAKNADWVWKKAKYILKLLLFSELFYGMWHIIRGIAVDNITIGQALEAELVGKNWIQVIFCGTLSNGVLWYLYAMFWTWIFVYVLKKINRLEKCYIIIPLLLGIQILGRSYVQNNYDITKYVFWFRNALTFGIPFVLLGTWIAQYEEKLKSRIGFKVNIGVIIAGFSLIVVEFLTVGQYMDLHISTVIIAIGLFLFAIRIQRPLNKKIKLLAYVGDKWYTWIYLGHVFFIDIVDILYDRFHFTQSIALGFARPLLVCMLTCLSAEFIIRLHNKVLERC